MTTLLSALAALYPSAAQCAAALGITRQAFSQAVKRHRLSDAAALRAAAILKINPGQALLANATGKDAPTPINNPTPHPIPQIQDEKKPAQGQPNNCPTTNYAKFAHRSSWRDLSSSAE